MKRVQSTCLSEIDPSGIKPSVLKYCVDQTGIDRKLGFDFGETVLNMPEIPIHSMPTNMPDMHMYRIAAHVMSENEYIEVRECISALLCSDDLSKYDKVVLDKITHILDGKVTL